MRPHKRVSATLRTDSATAGFARSWPRLLVVSALGIGTALSGCTRSSQSVEAQPFQLIQDVSPIFSTRPDPATHAFFLVKLRTPPLFTALETNGGKTSVNAEALKALDAEQSELLEKLQELSGEIKVIYRYRMVLNGFAVVAPTALQEKIGALSGVSHIEAAGNFDRPVLPAVENAAVLNTALQKRNSVKFIGGEEAHARGLRGQGTKVGIIDTGIDYTHAMFGGTGTEDAFKAVKPSEPAVGFPNAKVVGGLDFVGTEFNTASADFSKTIPVMDSNPIDEGGHGTHVAGTVAGHGDGQNTYDGVAPDASLYALKVFGADGSTGDTVVIAALEYSADPNGDGDLSDRLDVVNLSLGSGYGSGHILYTEAIRNLSAGGTMVVASGGNSGDTSYIVGSPGASEDALSVAASVDDMDHNWKFRAAKFSTVDKPEILTEAIEGTIGKPLDEAKNIAGLLVPAGLADQDFSPEMAAKLAGKIALIDRGGVPFFDKVQRAQAAGSLGVVVANNQPGAPIPMGGGDGTRLEIPAIMITQDLANELKSALGKGDVNVDLTTSIKIERPELIDTMAGFSSKGPRSIDALLKPEISAPGEMIVSAKMGGGAAGIRMSGTSMAAPHMAGVMALMKQAHPDLSTAELKSLVMGTAKTMVDEKGKIYPLARQGAGRVQILKALDAPVIALPSAISLGEVTVETRKSMQRTVELVGLSAAPLALNITLAESTKGLTLASAKTVNIKNGERATLDLRFTIDMATLNNTLKPNSSNEISGFVILSDSTGEIARIPVLAIATKISRLRAESLLVRSTSSADNQGAAADLTLVNKGTNAGDAYPFNFLGRGQRKDDPSLDPFRTKICDLAESGYRVISKGGVPTLQIAAKVFEPMTTWDLCEVSVLIDSDGDYEADQELAGIKQNHLEGLTAATFASVLIDAKVARGIRRAYDAAVLDFTPAITALSPMLAFEHSTIAIVEVPVSELKLKPSGVLAIRVATSAQTGSAIEPDDFLSKDPKMWKRLNVSLDGPSFVGLPEKVSVEAGETKMVSFTKGAGSESLWLAYPNGPSVFGGISRDDQAQTIRAKYVP